MDLALLRSSVAFAFGCTVLFSRTVAREQLAPSVALGIRFGTAGLILLGGVLTACAPMPLLPPPGEHVTTFTLGVFVYAIESTFFYMGLQRGTAAAVTLILYAYPAVLAVVEGPYGRRSDRAGGRCSPRPVGVGERHRGDRWRRGVAISTAGVLFVCGSVVMFSTYALLSHRVLPRTDSLTAAAWTTIGASVGVTAVRRGAGPVGDAVGGRRYAACDERCRNRRRVRAVLHGARPHRADTHRHLHGLRGGHGGRCWPRSSSARPWRPVVTIGGIAVLSGVVLAALAAPQPIETREAGSIP